MSTGFEDVLAANADYVADFHYGGFDGIAHAGIGVVTCMDSRIPPLEMLGLKPVTRRCCAAPAAGSPRSR